MTLSTGQLDKLKHLLQAELGSAQALQQIIEREYQILNSGDAEEIETVTKEKLSGMSVLQQQLAEREQFLSKCAVLGVAATETLISNLPADTGITSSWRQLKDIGAKLKRQNEINGVIITLGQRNTQNALGVLSGRQPSASATYNPDGARQRDFGSSTLAKV